MDNLHRRPLLTLNMLGNIIRNIIVLYNYNALCGGLHEICSTARSFDLRCESVTLAVGIYNC